MDTQLYNLKRKVDQYKEILGNAEKYRNKWKESLRDYITDQLKSLSKESRLEAKIELRSDMENLEAVVLNLGEQRSGMFARVTEDVERHLIKHNGSLIYQQLFNGKIIVLINYPYIENYGKPRSPKTIAIYRPEELKDPFFFRHLEEFLTEITNWEDFDDDEPNKRIGFELNFGQTPLEDARDKPS